MHSEHRDFTDVYFLQTTFEVLTSQGMGALEKR